MYKKRTDKSNTYEKNRVPSFTPLTGGGGTPRLPVPVNDLEQLWDSSRHSNPWFDFVNQFKADLCTAWEVTKAEKASLNAFIKYHKILGVKARTVGKRHFLFNTNSSWYKTHYCRGGM